MEGAGVNVFKVFNYVNCCVGILGMGRVKGLHGSCELGKGNRVLLVEVRKELCCLVFIWLIVSYVLASRHRQESVIVFFHTPDGIQLCVTRKGSTLKVRLHLNENIF